MKHISNFKTFESTSTQPWRPLYDEWKKENENEVKGLDFSRALFKFKEDCLKNTKWSKKWNKEWLDSLSKEMNAAQDDELNRHQRYF